MCSALYFMYYICALHSHSLVFRSRSAFRLLLLVITNTAYFYVARRAQLPIELLHVLCFSAQSNDHDPLSSRCFHLKYFYFSTSYLLIVFLVATPLFANADCFVSIFVSIYSLSMLLFSFNWRIDVLIPSHRLLSWKANLLSVNDATSL